MLDFSILFIICGAVGFMLTSIILFFLPRKQPDAFLSKLLSIVFFVIGWSTITYMFILSGLIRLIPWWYGYGIPMYPLIPPLAYFYVRGTINRQSGLSKRDLLHFIPSLVCLVAMMPFYFLSMAEKSKVVNAIADNVNNLYFLKTGLIPPAWQFICRPIQSWIYLFLQCGLLLQLYNKQKANKALAERKIANKWLIAFVSFQLIVNTGVSIAAVKGYGRLSLRMDSIGMSKMPMVWESLLFFILCFVLFFTPNVLYGGRHYSGGSHVNANEHPIPNDAGILIVGIEAPIAIDENPGRDTLVADRGSEITAEQLSAYIAQLEAYIADSEIFRKQGISINELAVNLEIPSRTLSQIINQHYNQRFTDYINAHRIAYFKARIASGDFKLLTLESLALDAGFSSRSTFFTAFKKITGLTPTDYINSLPESESCIPA